MTPTDHDLEALLSLCESSDFNHRTDVLALLRDVELASRLGARVNVHEIAAGHDLASIRHALRSKHTPSSNTPFRGEQARAFSLGCRSRVLTTQFTMRKTF